jgi:hypothetical protein
MRRHVRGGMRPCPCATGCLSRVDSARCSRRGPLLTAPAARVVRYRYTCAHVDVRGRGGQNGRLSRRLESILSHASYVASLVGYPIGTFSAFISQVYMNYIFRFCTVHSPLHSPLWHSTAPVPVHVSCIWLLASTSSQRVVGPSLAAFEWALSRSYP